MTAINKPIVNLCIVINHVDYSITSSILSVKLHYSIDLSPIFKNNNIFVLFTRYQVINKLG